MNKKIYMSVAVCMMVVNANATDLGTIEVDKKITIESIQNISGQEVKSADLAETLENKIPSISLIRRSGVANDVILRGQKRDNIKVTVDGTTTYGACVNRMDPPISHIVNDVIDNIEVSEGPFDVEDFGVLSGSIKVKTKKPTKKLKGKVEVNIGSFGYRKAATTVSGGNDKVRVLFSVSGEKGEQYQDGNGDTLAKQLENYTASTPSTTDDPYNYSTTNKDKDAFEKTTYMGKVFVDIDEHQELRLGYTANRSHSVLYPSSKMDAVYDDSDIFNVEYIMKNMFKYSKQLNIQLYHSQVDHPMSTQYREIAVKMGKYMTNHLTTDMTGLKIKNNFDVMEQSITYGVDMSKRNWDGEFTSTSIATGAVKKIGNSLDDVDTNNVGLFVKYAKTIKKTDLEVGVRYDTTKIDTKSATEDDTDFNSLSANIFATYNMNKTTKYFIGIGKSSRVPDARELYNIKYNTSTTPPTRIVNGNPNLNQTTNYEIDFGLKKTYENSKIQLKTFYSKLKDYIYYNGTKGLNHAFENIDAHIYGAELSGSYTLSDDMYFEAGVAYKRGKKDTQPTGQKDTDLAEITPLKLNASAVYDYDDFGDVELSVVAATKWSHVDEDNGEQKLPGYGVFNLKTTRDFDNGFELIAGIDNIFDKTYTITNTYKDLILVTGDSNTMLINEPGRYVYVNMKYKF